MSDSAGEPGPLIHHELCFGCGRTNLFGLLAELAPDGPDQVAGRCFIKQDHQGPGPGSAHPGIVAGALIEAMSFARGRVPPAVEVRFEAQAPVGEFLELEATQDTATASVSGRLVASARTSRG